MSLSCRLASQMLTTGKRDFSSVTEGCSVIRRSGRSSGAETIENSVTQILEQQLTGIDGLLYFASSSSSRGSVSITATFEKGTDPDIAQVARQFSQPRIAVGKVSVDQYLVERVAHAQPRFAVDRQLQHHPEIGLFVDVQKIVPASADQHGGLRVFHREIYQGFAAAGYDKVEPFSFTRDQFLSLFA